MVKAMRRRAMRPASSVAKGMRKQGSVFRGKKSKTKAGLQKSDLEKNASGRIVSKKQSAAGKEGYAKNNKLQAWVQACSKARQFFGLKGFHAVKKGSALYEKAKEFYGE